MTESDSELLRRYVDHCSEAAFEALVHRHLSLVHSAALRQVDGDPTLAEEATQTVFIDLARQARRLTHHPTLTAWLYTATRLAASNWRRVAQRRLHREHQALLMNPPAPVDSAEIEWDRLRPVLDEAIHELSGDDRSALLHRFFERRSWAEIGQPLGLTQNAARMRVDRALEQLRTGLRRRGITSTAAALLVALGDQVLADVPAGLPERISRKALSAVPIGGPRAWLGTLPSLPKLAGGVALIALLVVTWLSPRWFPSEPPATGALGSTNLLAVLASVQPAHSASADDTTRRSNLVSTADDEGTLELTLVSAETGEPVPNVLIERGWVTDAQFVSGTNGTARITYPTSAKQLRLTTRQDGFADTCLKWSLERGEMVPERYTIRLARSVPIGGRVVDSAGQPVEGARVGFGHIPEPATDSQTETHEFGSIAVNTDRGGHWKIDRIAGEMLRRLSGSAQHSEYPNSEYLDCSRNTSTEAELRSLTHQFTLPKGYSVSGVVVDPENRRVPGAKVLVGQIKDSASREAVADATGEFKVRGCPGGPNFLTAEANGFAAVTILIEITNSLSQLQIALEVGRELRLRVVDQAGLPIPKAWVVHTGLEDQDGDSGVQTNSPVQSLVELRTNAEGLTVWSNAPDRGIGLTIVARGFKRKDHYKLRPDNSEHRVVLSPALTVLGAVRDANSGKPIPKFRIILGSPRKDPRTGKPVPWWSSNETGWLTFGNGAFRHVIESSFGPPDEWGYVFKFEAEGYRSFISRRVATDEGEVRLDVSLSPARTVLVTVLTPKGQPAADAEIALLASGDQAVLSSSGFTANRVNRGTLLRTDNEGRFKLPADSTIQHIFAWHPDGFAEARPSQLDKEDRWTLKPWGRIDGRCLRGGEPLPKQSVALREVEGITARLGFDWDYFSTVSDAAGRFSYERVPPGRVVVSELTRIPDGNGHILSLSQSTVVTVKSGASSSVTLGTPGYRIRYKPVWASGESPPAEPIISPALAILTAPQTMPDSVDGTLASTLVTNGQSEFEVRGASDYALLLFAELPRAAGSTNSSSSAWMSRPVFFTVPSSPSTGVIELGEIELSRQPTPVPAGK